MEVSATKRPGIDRSLRLVSPKGSEQASQAQKPHAVPANSRVFVDGKAVFHVESADLSAIRNGRPILLVPQIPGPYYWSPEGTRDESFIEKLCRLLRMALEKEMNVLFIEAQSDLPAQLQKLAKKHIPVDGLYIPQEVVDKANESSDPRLSDAVAYLESYAKQHFAPVFKETPVVKDSSEAGKGPVQAAAAQPKGSSEPAHQWKEKLYEDFLDDVNQHFILRQEPKAPKAEDEESISEQVKKVFLEPPVAGSNLLKVKKPQGVVGPV